MSAAAHGDPVGDDGDDRDAPDIMMERMTGHHDLAHCTGCDVYSVIVRISCKSHKD